MTIQLVRKPPIGNVRSEQLKAMLAGNHTIKQQASMFMQLKFCPPSGSWHRLRRANRRSGFVPADPTSWNVRGSSATNSNRIMPKDRDRDRER